MQHLKNVALALAVIAIATVSWAADYVQPTKPASSLVTENVGPTPRADEVTVHAITWGPDLVTYLANGGPRTTPDSAFGKAGLNVVIRKEDDSVKQANDYISGVSPTFRGTMGMLNTYLEAFNADARTKPVVVLQLSRSTGGDCLVVRGDIRQVSDLRGRTVLLQHNGPHVEFLDKLLTDAGLSWGDVNIKWCEELYDLDGLPNDPASIMRSDPSIDAVFCIYPDAVALSSGSGEYSVEGARILLTTKTAGNVIVDVLAFRSDFYEANKEWVRKFVETHLAEQDNLAKLMKDKGPDYDAAISMGADLLLDNPNDTEIMEGLLADATLARGNGNWSFFINKGNLAGFLANIERNQRWLTQQGFVRAAQTMAHPDWSFLYDFGDTAAAAMPVVNVAEAQQFIGAIDDSGILMEFEIKFGVNQESFQVSQYRQDFRKALEWSANYSGAIIEVVGHSDPYGYLVQKYNEKASDAVLERMWKSGQTLSLQRANAVRDSLIEFAKADGITVNEGQFITTGKGYEDPAVPRPSSNADLEKNRRVEFRIINVESESGLFSEPINF